MSHSTRMVRLALLLAVVGLGCASGAGQYAGALPGSRLAQMKRFYVQQRQDDSRDIHLAIQQGMRERGLEVDAGVGDPPAGTDAVVTYLDRYTVNGTLYCIQLTIYLRDTQTGFITATGWSYRPSSVRQTPAGHARIILRELFGGAG